LDAYLIDHHVPDPSFTRKLALHVAEGFSFAHRGGLTHRDIKPQNPWIEGLEGGDWRCMILDFGLAPASEVDDGLSTTARLSQSDE
jgi:serine/threonine protein kinase